MLLFILPSFLCHAHPLQITAERLKCVPKASLTNCNRIQWLHPCFAAHLFQIHSLYLRDKLSTELQWGKKTIEVIYVCVSASYLGGLYSHTRYAPNTLALFPSSTVFPLENSLIDLLTVTVLWKLLMFCEDLFKYMELWYFSE